MSEQPFLCQFIDRIEDVPAKDLLGDILAGRCAVTKDSITNRKVLMLTNNYDPEANLVGIGLRNRGIDFIRLKIGDIPRNIRIRYSMERIPDHLKVELNIQKQLLDISKLSVIWLRNFDVREINFGGNEFIRTFSLQQWENAFQIFENNLRCNWISTLEATIQANDRSKQLSLAKAIGFEIPATLITNDPEAAHDFYNTYNGDIIVKALSHHSVEVQGKVYSMYTRRILQQDLSKLDDLVYAPCILQQTLIKKSELRVTVVGEQVFAAELTSQPTLNGFGDIHRSFSIGCIRVFNLSDTISESCISFVKSLGLRYGAIDFIVDKNNRLVFLEVNPTGDWYWIENKVKLPITKAMVDLIAGLV